MGIFESKDLVPVVVVADYAFAQEILTLLEEHDIYCEIIENYQDESHEEDGKMAVVVPDAELSDAQDIINQHGQEGDAEDLGDDYDDEDVDDFKDFGEFDPMIE